VSTNDRRKRNIVHRPIEEYDIQSAEDIQDELKDLLYGTIQEMKETEIDNYLGYEESERSDNSDYRNCYKRKQVNNRYGSMEIKVPQNRESTFSLQIEDWQKRPLDETYPILYIDVIHYSIQDNSIIHKLTSYVILGINTEGEKEVLTITIGENESKKC